MDERDGGAGIVRVVGTWLIVAGLVVGLVAAGGPGMGYPSLAGLLVICGIGLRIEAAIRGVGSDARRARSSPHAP